MVGPRRLDRMLIRVSGPDTRAFLQNLLTQDLERLDETRVLYGALLSPQGKLVVDMFLWAQPDRGVLIDADPTRGGDLLRRLAMYKLRAQVTLENIGAGGAISVSTIAFADAVPDPRLAAIGWRALTPSGHVPNDGAMDYAYRLVELGVPDLARDAQPEEIFALEGLLEELNGVALHKGCFIGQENVSRMKRRATTRKKFCPIIFDGEAPPYGAPVLAGEAEIGSVRSGMPCRALALLRLDRALDAPGELTVGGRVVRLAPPPWLLPPAGA